MNDKRFNDIGTQISDAVQDALNSGNFSQLKQTISNTMGDVLDKTIYEKKNTTENLERKSNDVASEINHVVSDVVFGVGNALGEVFSDVGGLFSEKEKVKPNNKSNSWTDETIQRINREKALKEEHKHKIQITKLALKEHKRFLRKATGRMINSTFLSALGFLVSVPSIIISILAIIATLTSAEIFSEPIVAGIISIPVALVFLSIALVGISNYNKAFRYKVYRKLMYGKKVIEIEQLMKSVKKPSAFVLKEIKKFFEMGMFPKCYIDEQQTCVMIGEDTYNQYLLAQEQLRVREMEEIRRQENPDLTAVIEEGGRCLQQIKEANAALPEKEISDKLRRLEIITSKIFEYIEIRPHKLSEIRKFMSYYLPTTVKLVNSYKNFDAQPVQGENVAIAKKEILEILDTINKAFESLFDNLFKDDAMDVSTDISVLKTMLTQEGLTEKDFKIGGNFNE